MSMFNRIVDMASKALNKPGEQNSGSGDWRSVVRSAADALTGDGREQQAPARPAQQPPSQRPVASNAAPMDAADRAALARYDYLLQTADPQQIEVIHAEAFARLTPEQRTHVQARMNEELPSYEHPKSAEPADLARAAARGEATKPGLLPRLLAKVPGGGARPGGAALAGGALAGAGLAAGGVLVAVAGGAIVSNVGGSLLEQAAGLGVDFEALTNGLDVEALTGGLDLEGLTGGLGDLTAGAGDVASGLGEQVSGFGEQLGNFELPGLGDLFGR